MKVPLGTEVRDLDSGEMICELMEHEEQFLLLEGGKGGRGNATFKSSTNQTRQFTEGKPGDEGEFVFTLKTIADVGLWGFQMRENPPFSMLFPTPRPRLIPIPFTTLVPTVGVIDYPEDFKTVTMADVPD